ncbi:phosphatase PAP2/dual specificity phosphatase family protein [Labrys sp. KNU-23]|uniref:phosphatase PAP2/dual specificity phosphatase family protein n=1 Tax=Labrys sp. KNU-23 TaxID=2789216 RepID=UPI0011EBF626|nr:phosphatase PAP2/dual specificity phosphatase family protein [Labrys sp. KNU-23]QEN90125.1 phosphatase PAP2/dual specificity phosphatase family protein [Labrys sp. KNU-23]
MSIAVPARPTDGGRPEKRPWGRALLWLAGLGIFFYSSYGLANYLADRRAFVPSIVFGWERGMPFLPWTIVPYWSVNLFYAASLFVCTSRVELGTLGRRLLTAQVIAVACFLVFPLRFSFAKPEIGGGLPGFMFDALLSFDKPYNQAPSLHIALLVILWVHYADHLPSWARWLLHPWFALIGLSVLTTYQHHFFDIPTGALLGLFCLWLWPDESLSRVHGRPVRSSLPASVVLPGADETSAHPGGEVKRRKLAAYYGGGALVLALAGIALGGWGLWLCYPAASLVLVAANYLWRGAAGFQKRADGSMSLATRLLFAPYQLGAFLNSRWWTRRESAAGEVRPGVYLGRIPSRFDRAPENYGSVVDLAAELPAWRGIPTQAVPMLDLIAPKPASLVVAAKAIEAARGQGKVLVCCALGYSRSAAAVTTWLLASGEAKTVDEAIAIIRAIRPRIVLGSDARAAITAAGRVDGTDG